MNYTQKLEKRLSQIVAWAVYYRGKLLTDKEWDELYDLLLIKSTIMEVNE